MYLVNDNGNALLPDRTMTSGGTLSNGQCTVNWGGSAVTVGGNSLSLTLNITFSPALSDNVIFYLAARDVNEANNASWEPVGTWAIQ
jgi:hypothetical protein